MSAEDRELACKALANCLVDEADVALDFVLSHNAVAILLTRLVDVAPGVATAACGCLRNAVVAGDHLIAAHLVALGGLDPLLAAVPRAAAAAAAAAAGNDESLVRTQLQLLAELLALVTYLCESSELVAQQLTAGARDFLALALASALLADDAAADPTAPIAHAVGVPLAAAQLLYTLVEDNEAFVAVLAELRADVADALGARMQTALAARDHLLATVLAGVLCTVALRQGAPLDAVLAAVAPTLDAALKLDLVQPFGAIVNAMTPLANAAGAADPADFVNATQPPALRTGVLQWRAAMSCARTALVIWTDLLGEASASVDDAAQLSGALRERAQTWLGALLVRCTVAPAVSEAVKACPFLAAPVLDLQVENFALVQLLAVRAVTNTLYVLGIDELGREPQRVWDFLVRLALKGAAAATAPDDADADATFTSQDAFWLCESATSALWTLLRAEHPAQRSPRIAPQPEQLTALRQVLAIEPASLSNEVVGDGQSGEYDLSGLVMLLANVVGVNAALGARAVPDVEHAVALAQVLAQLLNAHSSCGALVAEVLNALFDCFAEDDFNAALKPLRMVESLRSFAPHVQQLVAAAAAAGDEALAERLAETLENVHAFIEYKSTR